MRPILAYPLALLFVALQGCDSGTGSGSANGNTGWDTTYSEAVVSLAASRIVTQIPMRIHGSCRSSSAGGAAFTLDTTLARLDTANVIVEEPSLWLASNDTFLIANGHYLEYTGFRRSTGTGLQGVWDFNYGVRLVAFGVPETDSALSAERSSRTRVMAALQAAGMAEQVEISPTSILVRERDGDWATISMASWREYNSTYYDVGIQQVDGRSFNLTTGDTVVTLRRANRRSTEYSSNFPAKYPTYIQSESPSGISDCPQNPWISIFLSHHVKSSATTARSLPITSQAAKPDPFHRPI